MRIGVVLAGGASSQSSAEQLLPRVLADDVAMADAVIVAADSGLDLARRLGIVPTLVVGDLVHGRAHAWLEGGIGDGAPRPDIASWKRALAELSRFGSVEVYGGRGEVLPLDVATKEQTTYLDAADSIVGSYVKALGPRRAELSDPKASGAHWKALSVKLSERFPSYALPYMVEYGVYGLALSKARE